MRSLSRIDRALRVGIASSMKALETILTVSPSQGRNASFIYMCLQIENGATMRSIAAVGHQANFFAVPTTTRVVASGHSMRLNFEVTPNNFKSF